ncbi:MAG: nucleobase:cation symporter-2 family protein [Microcoleaceae cyanobacterium]
MAQSQEIGILEEEAVDTPKVQIYSELVYQLEDKPPVLESLFAALQHVMASFVGVITPALVICNALGLPPTDISYIVSMSLFVSGIATFIQVRRIGPVGSGLLSLQGTSFAFVGPILGVGTAAIAAGRTPQEALGLIFGLCFFGAFVEVILSRFLHLASKIITPIVSGTVVTIIGLSLIRVGMTSMAGGFAAKANGTFGSIQNLGLALLVLVIVVGLNLTGNRWLRISSVIIGLIVGYVIAIFLGIVDFSNLSQLSFFQVPIPFRYGMSFDFAAFVPFIFMYLITSIETIGDLTATSAISKQPISGGVYMRRMKGGVLGDGVNSLLAAVFNSFPNTTFSQNNGVIQMTGIGSRYVGMYMAGILVFLGLVPIIGGVFQALPQPVLGGATIVMFGSIAVAGINIISSVDMDRRSLMIVVVSLALGMGVAFVPEIFDNLPPLVKNLFSSGISTGGLTAILLNAFLPRSPEMMNSPNQPSPTESISE